jgi:hypothetical protein
LSEKRKKYYLVISERNRHVYGAFRYSSEGFAEAEIYIKKISRVYKGEIFKVEEK